MKDEDGRCLSSTHGSSTPTMTLVIIRRMKMDADREKVKVEDVDVEFPFSKLIHVGAYTNDPVKGRADPDFDPRNTPTASLFF